MMVNPFAEANVSMSLNESASDGTGVGTGVGVGVGVQVGVGLGVGIYASTSSMRSLVDCCIDRQEHRTAVAMVVTTNAISFFIPAPDTRDVQFPRITLRLYAHQKIQCGTYRVPRSTGLRAR